MFELIHGNCIEKMRCIASGSVDLTVTSPPYDDLRTYNGNNKTWGEAVWRTAIYELFRVTKKGGVVVWIVGDATKQGSESGTSFRQALFALECGFNLHDTMIYEKAQSCFGSNNCYLQSFEYMFIFSKGKPRVINFIRDRENVRSGTETMSAGGLDPDGTKKIRIKKKMTQLGKRKNIWKYGVGGGKTGHPAVFPEKLAFDHVTTWSNEFDIVLDPFAGSGTVGVVCKKLNRNFIGIELDPEYFKIAEKRIINASQEI